MTSTRFTTSGGVNIEKSMTPLDDKQALDKIYQYIDTTKVRYLSVIMKSLTVIPVGIWVLSIPLWN